MPLYALGDKTPKISGDSWIAENAVVIGDVTLEPGVSIWFNTVIRGDCDPVRIGRNSNIQDSCVLHTDEGVPMSIGSNVTVGHQVMLHGCTIEDGCLIGINAVILNHAVIGKESLIGANTLIPEGKVIPPRSLVMGSPGKVVRTLTDEDIHRMSHGANHYVENAARYRRDLHRIDEP